MIHNSSHNQWIQVDLKSKSPKSDLDE